MRAHDWTLRGGPGKQSLDMDAIPLLEQCAPAIAPVTMAAIVQQESGGNPLALHDNTTGKSYRPGSVADAARIARELIAQGHSVDIGLAQINSRNLPRLGVSVDEVLDPCRNLQAAQAVLLDGWTLSGTLAGALSAYNTGRIVGARGAKYGAGVYAQAGVVVPAIPGGRMAQWTLPGSALPPVRPSVSWTPQASPLKPGAGNLQPRW